MTIKKFKLVDKEGWIANHPSNEGNFKEYFTEQVTLTYCEDSFCWVEEGGTTVNPIIIDLGDDELKYFKEVVENTTEGKEKVMEKSTLRFTPEKGVQGKVSIDLDITFEELATLETLAASSGTTVEKVLQGMISRIAKTSNEV